MIGNAVLTSVLSSFTSSVVGRGCGARVDGRVSEVSSWRHNHLTIRTGVHHVRRVRLGVRGNESGRVKLGRVAAFSIGTRVWGHAVGRHGRNVKLRVIHWRVTGLLRRSWVLTIKAGGKPNGADERHGRGRPGHCSSHLDWLLNTRTVILRFHRKVCEDNEVKKCCSRQGNSLFPSRFL